MIKEDTSFELLPASIALRELILDNSIKLNEVMDCEILELTNGYICVSQLSGIKIEDINPNKKGKDFLTPDW